MNRPTRKEPRDRQLNLSLTVSEWEGIRQRTEALGMRPAHFGRAALLGAKDFVPTRSEARSDDALPIIRTFYNQLIRIGSNLNQLIRHLHRTGEPVPADLEPLLKDIRALIDRVPR